MRRVGARAGQGEGRRGGGEGGRRGGEGGRRGGGGLEGGAGASTPAVPVRLIGVNLGIP